MKRTVDGDCFPTFRRLGRRLLGMRGGLLRAAKRTAKVLVVFLIVLAIVHGIATFITGRKLEADIRSLKAKGELPSITELVGPKIPDSENAALVYAKAFKLIPGPQTNRPDYDQLWRFADAEKRKADPESWDRARVVVRKYEKALLIAERAASMEKCRFPVKWEDGILATFTHYAPVRQLAQLANASGLIAARDGRMDDSVRWIALSLRISEAVKNEPILIGVLVRGAIIHMTCRSLQEAVQYGDLNDEQTARLSRLLAENDLRPHYRKALHGERATGLIAFEQIRKDPRLISEVMDLSAVHVNRPTSPRLVAAVLKPVLYADERFYLHHMGKIIADADRPTNGSDLAQLEEVHLLWAPVSSLLIPVFSRVKMAVHESLAETRICRTALALSSYERQHGEYPDSLALLSVSDVEMLEDPFSGKDLIYKRQAKGFVLYSIGPDMKDDGGQPLVDQLGEPPKGDIIWQLGVDR